MFETYNVKLNRKVNKKQKIIEAASGREKADLVFKNATYVNVFSNELCKSDIAISEGLIIGLGDYQGLVEIDASDSIILPGFLDAHIHLESSLVSPNEFAKAVLPHGTTTVITDPHEIANVMGIDGIDYMLEETESSPVDVRFMLPSCVPATYLDESGANLDYKDIDSFYNHPRVEGLAEMMDFSGIINNETSEIRKIVSAQIHHKKIDGHAPHLDKNDLNTYIAAGIYSDHECQNLDDAIAKLQRGQFIMIREGTAAKNLEALCPLLCEKYADRCMFCTDDKHPNDLLENGHMDYIVKKAIKLGVDPIIAVKVASHNTARYFSLNNRGAIAPGYLGDLILIDNFEDFNIKSVYKKGLLVAENGKTIKYCQGKVDSSIKNKVYNTFHIDKFNENEFTDNKSRTTIGIIPGEIVTKNLGYNEKIDIANDILRIAVVERHKNTHHIGLGYIKGYGLKSGAVATSISHDSHNIIVVGTNETDITAATNKIIDLNGGIVVFENGKCIASVPLPIAGIMSDEPLEKVNEKLKYTKSKAYSLGVYKNVDPFMTLSFMALPVLPSVRITTQGVFDVLNKKYN